MAKHIFHWCKLSKVYHHHNGIIELNSDKLFKLVIEKLRKPKNRKFKDTFLIIQLEIYVTVKYS